MNISSRRKNLRFLTFGILTFVLSMPFAENVYAQEIDCTYVDVGNPGTGIGDPRVPGGAGPPPPLVPQYALESAIALREQFQECTRDSLQLLDFAAELCLEFECAVLSEAQASLLLDRTIAFENETANRQERFETKWITRMGVLFTALGLFVAWLAYRQSKEADRRSIRNEVEIQHLKETDA